MCTGLGEEEGEEKEEEEKEEGRKGESARGKGRAHEQLTSSSCWMYFTCNGTSRGGALGADIVL